MKSLAWASVPINDSKIHTNTIWNGGIECFSASADDEEEVAKMSECWRNVKSSFRLFFLISKAWNKPQQKSETDRLKAKQWTNKIILFFQHYHVFPNNKISAIKYNNHRIDLRLEEAVLIVFSCDALCDGWCNAKWKCSQLNKRKCLFFALVSSSSCYFSYFKRWAKQWNLLSYLHVWKLPFLH